MMFDPKSYELRQWTITDAQGKDTTVMIFNVKEGVSFDRRHFTIDYTANRELNTKTQKGWPLAGRRSGSPGSTSADQL